MSPLQESPSRLVCEALGLPPSGKPYRGAATHCAMCGASIVEGQIAAPNEMPQSFTDHFAMRPGTHVCGYCAASSVQAVLRHVQRSVVTSKGIFSIGSDDARAWFLLTPPEPPFVAVVQTRSAMATYHLHWRTPITVDLDLLVVRVDDHLLRIRRPVLRSALAACERVAEALTLNESDQAGSGRRRAPRASIAKPSARRRHPFVALDRALAHPRHGVLRSQAAELPQAFQDDVRLLAGLWPGELWALATLAKANAPVPTAPLSTNQL